MPRFTARHSARIVLFLLAASILLKAQTPAFRTTTQLVEIDTVARDSHGKPVTDLKAEDFRVVEDGAERPLSHFSFERVEPIDPKAAKRLHDLAATQRPGVYASFTPDTAAIPPNGCTVLLVDWLNTPLELQQSAEQELKKFLQTVDLSKPLAIYSLDSDLRQLQKFTSDRQVLLSNVERYGLHNANLQPEKRASHQLDSEINDFRVMKSAAALLRIGSTLDGIAGHKSLIWLSGSFPTALIPTNLTGLTPLMEHSYGGYVYGDRRDYSGVITQVSHTLSAANIAVYPVDAQGLQTGMADASQFSFQLYINPIYQATFERQEAMRDVADLTGGRPFYNHNDIANEITAAYEDANTFYALAFTPAKAKPDGKVHSVRVDCRRAGVHLSYRKSYYADDKQALVRMKRSELELLVRTLGQPADGLPFMAQLDKQQNDRLKLWIDGDALSIVGGPTPFLTIDVGVATFDAQGNLLQQNYADMRIKIVPSQLHEVQVSGLAQTLQFARAKESARLRVAIRDLVSGRVGTLELPLQ